MSESPKVVVIGGGIGGLTAGLALAQRGLDVQVYEQASAIGEIGAGVTLSPNALKAYRGMGLQDAIEGIGFESEFQVVRAWDTGEEVSRVNRKGYEQVYGAPYLSFHRADLVEVLANSLPAGALRLGTRCTSVETVGDKAIARFEDGREVEADLIIGADGIRSAVRQSLFGADSPRFTGTACWRGLVPYDAFAPGEFDTNWHLYVGENKHVIYYMVRQGDIVNFVAHVDTDEWTGESWTQESDPREILDAFEGWHAPLYSLLTKADKFYKWALFDRDPLDSWTKGRVTLLGDAAHAMPPFIGQGGGMSIEDAYVLAAAIARTPADIPTALELYELLRIDRANSMVHKARAARDQYHGKSELEAGAAKADDATGLNHHAIYDYDVRKVADFSSATAV